MLSFAESIQYEVWVWRIGGMILLGKTEVLEEKPVQGHFIH
jgi:hypothetical protein